MPRSDDFDESMPIFNAFDEKCIRSSKSNGTPSAGCARSESSARRRRQAMQMKGQRSDAHPRNPDVVRSSTRRRSTVG
jgi:hypothetical protein